MGVAGRSTAALRPAPTRSRSSPARARAASSTSRRATRSSWPRPSPLACAPCTTRSSSLGFDAILVVGPEHARVFAEAGWDRERMLAELARAACSCPGRESCAAPAASPRACPSASRDATLPKFRPDGMLLVHAGGGAGPVLCHHRRAGRTAPAGSPAGHQGGAIAMTHGSCSIRPSERTVARARRGCDRPASLDGLDRRPARHLQAARRRLPRPPRGAARRASARTSALHEADVHQAGAGRPAPRDRHPVRARDRGARRLRQLHVVQCARHRRSRAPGRPGVFVASARVRRGRRAPVARRSASRPWRASSRRTRSRTAPTTRCAPTPTRAFDEIVAAVTASCNHSAPT